MFSGPLKEAIRRLVLGNKLAASLVQVLCGVALKRPCVEISTWTESVEVKLGL